MSAAVNVLLTLAIANDVDRVTTTLSGTSARPLTPDQVDPSGRTIATETPGIAYRSRSRSSRACSVRRVVGARRGRVIDCGGSTTGGEPAWGPGLGATLGVAVAPGVPGVPGVPLTDGTGSTPAGSEGVALGVGAAVGVAAVAAVAGFAGPSTADARVTTIAIGRSGMASRTPVRRGRDSAMHAGPYSDRFTATIPGCPVVLCARADRECRCPVP